MWAALLDSRTHFMAASVMRRPTHCFIMSLRIAAFGVADFLRDGLISGIDLLELEADDRLYDLLALLHTRGMSAAGEKR